MKRKSEETKCSWVNEFFFAGAVLLTLISTARLAVLNKFSEILCSAA